MEVRPRLKLSPFLYLIPEEDLNIPLLHLDPEFKTVSYRNPLKYMVFRNSFHSSD